MTVQAFVTMAFILSFSSQFLIALELVRWPLNFVLEYEWLLSAICFIGNATASKFLLVYAIKNGLIYYFCFLGVFLFLAVCIFGGEAYRRDWMMYPQYNFISWSYGLAVISMFFHAFAAAAIYFVSLYLSSMIIQC